MEDKNLNFHKDLYMDLFLPEQDEFFCIVYFHGGGLVEGDKGDSHDFVRHLTKLGFAVATANYSLLTEKKFPECVKDAAMAVRYVRDNISRYGRCKGILVSGQSAGAYLTLMLCLNKEYLKEVGIDNMIPTNRTGRDGWRLPYERYPFAACELGGGLESTHHRRYIIRPYDVYAPALIKVGSGCNLPGYYMYHGGTNPVGKLSTFQESKASGYPNDVPMLSYDFQAPVSEYGEIRPSYRLLNLMHLFLQDFGDRLAPMPAFDSTLQVKRDDTTTIRAGLRTDGKSGFVFVNHYQRRSKLADLENVVFDTGSVPLIVPKTAKFVNERMLDMCVL